MIFSHRHISLLTVALLGAGYSDYQAMRTLERMEAQYEVRYSQSNTPPPTPNNNDVLSMAISLGIDISITDFEKSLFDLPAGCSLNDTPRSSPPVEVVTPCPNKRHERLVLYGCTLPGA